MQSALPIAGHSLNGMAMVKQGRGAILCVFLVAFFSFVSVTAQAQTILHVNRTDPTCGGQSPCFTTIQAALNAAGPNTVIQIQAGTYPEQLTITGKNNFPGATEVDRIIVQADPATQPGRWCSPAPRAPARGTTPFASSNPSSLRFED